MKDYSFFGPLGRAVWILALLLLDSHAACGQAESRWEIGGCLGAVGYLGDLNQQDLMSKEFNFSYQGFVRKYINTSNFAFRYNLQVGKFSGRDSNYPNRASRNLSIDTRFVENAFLIEWDYFDINPIYYRQYYGYQPVYTPYFFAGPTVVYTNPRPDFTQTYSPYATILEGIEHDKNARYAHWHLAFAFGGGMKFDLSPSVNLGIEASFRIATSDYVDGISKAGNPNRNDGYQLITMTGTYRLGIRRKSIRRKWR
ncbi:outer membrane beta-barrel protein [Runella sp. CRIBMP]|uniref:DUF6089 family protein n=1 Tax=Runella sp. CRIBMP TaxID=2683261 RepID=UPI00141202F3|nr:DUF6089 family protein [Runella sp. CRIBMP]NBB21838.1 outer membrane beta-barrel protein [Runella sp. CRIBMP]